MNHSNLDLDAIEGRFNKYGIVVTPDLLAMIEEIREYREIVARYEMEVKQTIAAIEEIREKMTHDKIAS